MKLLSFSCDAANRVGCEFNDSAVIDFADVAKAMGRPDLAPVSVMELIRGGDSARRHVDTLLAFAQQNPAKVRQFAKGEIEWLPPVDRPGKICCVALNNSASDERKISAPSHPMFFLKPATSLVGHNQPIVARTQYMGFHPEPELGVCISKTGRNIDPREAMDYVYGYTIINDVTGNDMRAEDRVHYYALYPKKENPEEVERREQHLSYTARYKGSDGFCPTGPWIVTRDEVENPNDLTVVCKVGNDVYADDSTKNYTYKVEEVVAYISRYHTLEAGDLIAMGTAFRAGGPARKPLHSANFARLDGPCDISISKLGTLSNPIMRDPTVPVSWRLPR